MTYVSDMVEYNTIDAVTLLKCIIGLFNILDTRVGPTVLHCDRKRSSYSTGIYASLRGQPGV